MKYIHYGAEGNLLSFYSTTIPDTVPIPNIEVTELEWEDLVGNASFRKIDINTKLIIKQEIPVTPPVITPDWMTFRKDLLADPIYQALSTVTTKQRDITRFENELLLAVTGATVKTAIKRFWDEAITGTPTISKPNIAKLQAWTESARVANLGISFAADGKLVLS